jgi:uncharacterized phage protein (TIGR01671 family)
MREIKFRAWQKHHKQMVKVTRIDFNRNLITADYGEKTVPRFNTFEQDNFILMQYTGLKDKNGREIYEGDIVKSDNGEAIDKIVYKQGAFYVESIKRNLLDELLSDVETEVIGNIYANPELLEGGT